jgi:hypothetical protein
MLPPIAACLPALVLLLQLPQLLDSRYLQLLQWLPRLILQLSLPVRLQQLLQQHLVLARLLLQL